jgi:Lrp/AsnC family leucine-responsive transcriptional regulator
MTDATNNSPSDADEGLQQDSGLDRIDRRILAILQDDGRISNLKLAERVACRPPPCWPACSA